MDFENKIFVELFVENAGNDSLPVYRWIELLCFEGKSEVIAGLWQLHKIPMKKFREVSISVWKIRKSKIPGLR